MRNLTLMRLKLTSSLSLILLLTLSGCPASTEQYLLLYTDDDQLTFSQSQDSLWLCMDSACDLKLWFDPDLRRWHRHYWLELSLAYSNNMAQPVSVSVDKVEVSSNSFDFEPPVFLADNLEVSADGSDWLLPVGEEGEVLVIRFKASLNGDSKSQSDTLKLSGVKLSYADGATSGLPELSFALNLPGRHW